MTPEALVEAGQPLTYAIATCVSCLCQGERDEMLRAVLVVGEMDIEDDMTKKMLIQALVARFG